MKLWNPPTRARFLSLARSKLRLCSANHRSGYWSNLPCDWPSTAWAYSEQEMENGTWSGMRSTYTTMVITSRWRHMNVMKSQITGHPTVCLTAYADPHERYIKVRITGPLRWIHRWPVNSPHKGPVTHKKNPSVCMNIPKKTIPLVINILIPDLKSMLYHVV